jgi:hypothetical protein
MIIRFVSTTSSQLLDKFQAAFKSFNNKYGYFTHSNSLLLILT